MVAAIVFATNFIETNVYLPTVSGLTIPGEITIPGRNKKMAP
jgi:hypothetical protein